MTTARLASLATLTAVSTSLLGASPTHGAISSFLHSHTTYDPDTSSMNAALGITPGYIVEDFEDSVLQPGLSIMIPGHSSFTVVHGAGVADEKWDGDCVLQNLDETPQDGRDVEFSFSTPVTRFGVGIGHLEQPTEVVVNGSVLIGNITSVAGWNSGGPNVRNGYLWITASDGDLISSVLFNGADQSDTIYFDHAAWIPTPASAPLLAAPLLLIARRRRRG